MSIKAKWQQRNQEWMDEMAASQLSETRAEARAEAFAQMGMADPAATDSPNDGSP